MFIFRLLFRLTVTVYPFTVLLFDMSTDVPVHLYTCSVCFLFFSNMHNDLSTHLLGYLHTDPPENIFTRLPSCFSFVEPQGPTCHHNYLCTCTGMYPFMTLPIHVHTVILINRLDLPVNGSTALHVHRYTCSSVYLFSLFLLFRHNIYSYLSTHLLGYVQTDPHASPLPKNKDLPITTTTCVPALKCTRS